MKFLEKDLEQIIYDADKELLAKRGLYIKGKLKRQLKIGNYGVADLVEFRRPFYNSEFKEMFKGEIIVYELKQDKIGISAFLQALGYIKGIQTYFADRGIEDKFHYSIKLIGKEIDINSTFVYLTDFLDYDTCYTNIELESKFSLCNYLYSYGFDGIKFSRESGFNLTNKGF